MGAALLRPNEYEASASLLFRDPGLDQKLFGSTFLAPSRDPEREAATNVRLVSLDVVADRAAKALRSGLSGDELERKIQVSPAGRSDVVVVIATDRRPEFAADIANEFARQYIAFRRGADRAKIREAEQLVSAELSRLSGADRTGPRGESLQGRLQELEILASLQTGNAELVQTAQSAQSPSAPKPFNSLLLGLFGGSALALFAVFLAERFDQRIRDSQEIETTVRSPVLATVPRSRTVEGHDAATAFPPEEAEAFGMLRANLRYFNAEHRITTVAITSAQPGDGKSTVAWNLSLTAARAGDRALLIEADLRKPSLSATRQRRGLTDVLTGESSLSDVVSTLSVNNGDDEARDTERSLDVLYAGALPPNPTALLESDRLHQLLDAACAQYDLVVIDTPPTTVVADAVPLITSVDGVIVIARLHATKREALNQLVKQLANLGAPTLGIVINFAPVGSTGYYSYGVREARV